MKMLPIRVYLIFGFKQNTVWYKTQSLAVDFRTIALTATTLFGKKTYLRCEQL